MQSRGQPPGRGQNIRVHGLGEPQAAGRTGRPAAPSPPNGLDAPPPRPRREPPVDQYPSSFARIKVIGVGGAGGNAINRMIASGVDGIEFVSVNTDAQALLTSQAPLAIRIGDKLTKGLGAGGRPEIGERAAEESGDDLIDIVRDCDMIFITAGMGGGTGTGASPVIAKLAKSAGALTVAVVTKPFEFEGGRRRRSADEGVAALKEVVDALITIPNERLIHLVDPKTPITQAFQIADDVLRQGIAGISDLITKPGVINLDFADVKTIMQDAGSALMAIGRGSGENRCADAAREAIESPLLEMNIQGATGVLYNITGGGNLGLIETSEAAEIIRQAADEDAEIIYGTSIDEALGDEVRITLIATGFDDTPPAHGYAVRNYGRPERGHDRDPRQQPRPDRDRDRGYERDRGPERAAERGVDRGLDRPAERDRAAYRAPQPRQAAAPSQPVQPDDDWEGDSTLLRIIRER